MNPRPLRFAMVSTFYPPYSFGGDAQAIRGLVHSLARRGHAVDVIHDINAYRMLSKGQEPEPLREPAGVRVHGLRSRMGSLSCLATHQLGHPVVHGARIRRILNEGFDVIHYHNISLVGGPGVLAYGKAIKIHTSHEHWLVCPSHVLWRHNRELCDRKECLRCVLRFGRPPQLWRSTSLLEKKSRHVDAFVTFSQFCADKHREFGFDRPLSVLRTFLPDVGSIDASPPPRDEPSNQPPFFLFVGRLEMIKGLQDLIPHFDDGSTAELWIAGSGNYEAELRKCASRLPKVRFLGQRTPAELRVLYRKAVAAILPSICYEVFPMVVLEAFREGTPIIARRLGPFPEIIAESRGGLLFETSDELKKALVRMASDKPLRDSFARSARQAFETLWSEDIALKEYLDLILKLAVRKGEETVSAKFANAQELSDHGQTQ